MFVFNRKIVNYLYKWKDKKNRKPLIIRGARQVGKTTAVKIFAKNFDVFIDINLEKAELFELFKNVKTLKDFEQIIQIGLGKKIIPQKTLIFIDEIQNIPNLIKILRFFYEEAPQIHIIASGSLLETQIKTAGFSMPVGRVEYAYLYPLTFFEFLEAADKKEILNFLKQVDFKNKIPFYIHSQAKELFYQYALLGGMPKIVSLYLQKANWEEINSVYASLLTAYQEDIYKYALRAEIKYLQYILEQAPYFAGQRFVYEKFGGSDYRSREMKAAFELLEKTMLLTQIRATKSTDLPLIKQEKRPKKLIFLDVGLVNFKNDIQRQFLGLKDLASFYRGKIAEQLVGQNLLANQISQKQDLYYWAREKAKSSAEVDFCLAQEGKIFGIEVKSGHSKKLKSLFAFADQVKNPVLVRIYDGELKQENIIWNQKKYKIFSVPFYLINQIPTKLTSLT